MKNGFWIENIIYSGDGVASTQVDFKPGFNIIHGPSDTGKTYLAKTIKYMLAGSTRPFSAGTGYSVISMTLRTDEGKVKLIRTIGSSKITVAADPVFGIPYDEYPAQPTESSASGVTVSDLLLRLLGIKERRVVLTNQYGSRKPLTWKSFSDTLHRSEGRITSEESIFTTTKFATLSAFLTLFYDRDLSLLPEHEDPAVVESRKNILLPFLGERLDQVGRMRETLKKFRGEDDGRDITAEITQLTAELSQLNTIQDQARQELSELTRNISAVEQELSVRTMAADRYEDLASVYIGDIKRLTFVADAQQAIQTLPEPSDCPFCGSPLSNHEMPDYKEAAQAEAEMRVGDLEELAQVQSSLNDQIAALEVHLKSLRDEQRSAETRLSEAVLPRITALKSQIADLEAHQARLTESRMLDTQHDELIDQITTLTSPPAPTEDYDPVDLFPSSFFTDMAKYLQEILAESQFKDADQAYLDQTDFDIRIGRKSKRSHGKGYRAFFNTVLVLTLRRYIHEHAIHKPSIVVIDTPTLGFEHQADGNNLITSRDESGRPKTGLLRNLFDYMVNSGDYGQLIVLNNTDVTPTTHFDRDDATELVFGINDEADRPGLLVDLREDEGEQDLEFK
ncbi:AAA family ATPase [Actinomyces sp. zg-332]|uniref:ATP-binding protein n=1 Tax=Actinomyces sp. zg-332 TaxID=2708340 RepID=UPI001422BEBE|nr:ATP-binding protein [Actinomyces sp. zg-332]QPK94467.1 AAA family ATPase [Actinomyces sp. zg-332]